MAKWGSKLLLGVVIVIAFLTLVQCSIKKPESPTWSTNFVVPVVNRTYMMDELVDRMDQDGVEINDSGDVVFSITEDLDTVALDQDNLSTGDLQYSVGAKLGVVDIAKPSIPPVSVSLSDLGGMSIVLPGDLAVVPDTSFDIEASLPTIADFSSATVSTGRVDVIITNQLGLTLDNISVDLADKYTSQVLASGTYASNLPSGSAASVPIVLDGVTVPADVKVITHAHTPLDSVSNFSTRYAQTDVAFGDTLQVSAAVARIPALSRTDSAIVALAENDRIDSAELAGGMLTLNVDNATNLDASIAIQCPDFHQGGTPLTINGTVGAGQNRQFNVNLTGYTLAPRSSVVPQDVAVYVTADMPGSGTNVVPVQQTDSFTVTADLTGLTFNSVTGLFQSVSATFNSITQDIEIPKGLENVELASAILTLEVENAIDLPGTLDIQISGNNGKATSFAGDITPRGLATAVTTTIVNDTVADFLSPLPSQVQASGSVVFGDGSYQGTITANDYVFARVKILAPLEMIINPTTIDTDIESEEVSQDNIDAITDHFIEGRFVYRLTNHLPLGAHVNIFIGADSATLFTNPQVRFDSLYVTAAPVDAGGIVTDTAMTPYQEIYLDNADVRVLENPTLYIGQQIMIDGSNGQMVKLTGDDYIAVVGRIEVEYLFDGEF